MNILSFYIPRISITYNELSIVIAFKNMNIGVVKRVDFMLNEETDLYQSAFVHMDFMYDNDYTEKILTNVFHNNKSIRVYPNTINRSLYWILLKNKNPITETRLNIHQLAENINKLEEFVMIQNEYIIHILDKIYNIENQKKQIKNKTKLGDLINELYS
jgi:hypothetical protein